ncbi:MAG TPA: hypothetical protein VGK73_05985 [Polyangiaceae bacterium]
MPAIVFYSWDQEYKIIDGEVQGEFPARFRMDVTEPPPPEALGPIDGQEGRATIGSIVVAPRSHPKTAPYLSGQGHSDFEDEDPDDGYLFFENLCTADGACLERTLFCHEEPCETVWQTEGFDQELYSHPFVLSDSSVDIIDTTYYSECSRTGCLALVAYCTAPDACESAIRSCPWITGPYTTVGSDGHIRRCELVERTGDPSIEEIERFQQVARGYYVVYSDEASNAFPGLELEAGYNLIRLAEPESREQWHESMRCKDEAARGAVARYNLEHGTSLVPYDVWDDEQTLAIDALAEELAKACPEGGNRWEVVSDPLAVPLTFVIGREASAGP